MLPLSEPDGVVPPAEMQQELLHPAPVQDNHPTGIVSNAPFY